MSQNKNGLLVFGAHPDDVEFGCGGIVALEIQRRPVHLVVCSLGEAGTRGTPEIRRGEAEKAAQILGATLEFIDLVGDGHIEVTAANSMVVAGLIRRVQPALVLAPTLAENQHPDHCRVGKIVRDAARVARYGGLEELKNLPIHAIQALFYYAITASAEPPILVDVSSVVETWTASMQAHASQLAGRPYVELALTRSHLLGMAAGVEYAIGLYPNDPVLISELSQVGRSARTF